jgi:hypothetical protein
MQQTGCSTSNYCEPSPYIKLPFDTAAKKLTSGNSHTRLPHHKHAMQTHILAEAWIRWVIRPPHLALANKARTQPGWNSGKTASKWHGVCHHKSAVIGPSVPAKLALFGSTQHCHKVNVILMLCTSPLQDGMHSWRHELGSSMAWQSLHNCRLLKAASGWHRAGSGVPMR